MAVLEMMNRSAILFSLLLLAGCDDPVHADGHLTDTRCCIEVARNPDGSIKRSGAAKLAFRKQNPCPTGAGLYDPCTGYAIDHVKPLFCGGIDHPINMQWLSIFVKHLKDNEEMFINCREKWVNR